MLNKSISKEKLNKIKLLILDSDGVSIPRGTIINEMNTKSSYKCFFRTRKITDEFIDQINELKKKKKIKICISSGRSLLYLQMMYEKIIDNETILQAENGNISLIKGNIKQHFKYNNKYFSKIAKIKKEIKHLPVTGFEPKQFILTVHAKREIFEVYKIVEKNDPEKELKVMWNGEAFDIQKKNVSKKSGLKDILTLLKIKKDEVIAIGDRINDKELLKIAGIGVSADIRKLKAEYYINTTKNELPGEILVDYLLKKL